MYTPFKLAFRNLWRRKSRTFIAFVGVVLAVSLFIAVNTTIDSLTVNLVEGYTAYLGKYDIIITGKGTSTFFDPVNMSEKVLSVEGVEEVVPALILRGITYIGDKKRGLLLIGVNTSDVGDNWSFEVIEGSIDISTNRCLVPDVIATNFDIYVGENFTLSMYNFEAKHYVNSSLTIGGIIKTPSELPVNMRRVVFVSLETLQGLSGLNNTVDVLFVKLSEEIINYSDLEGSVSKIVEIGSSIQEKIGLEYTVFLVKAYVLESVSGVVSTQRVMLNIFVLIAVLMACILIVSTMLMNVAERIREIGILRSVGSSKAQIFTSILIEAIIIGLIGSTVGLGLGLLLGKYVISPSLVGFRKQFQVSIFVVSPQSLNLGLLLGVLTSIIGGFYPAYSASKMTPLEALSPAVRRMIITEKEERKLRPERVNVGLVIGGISLFAATSFMMFLLPIIGFYGNQSIFIMVTFISLGLILVGLTLTFTAILPLTAKFFSKIVGKLWKIEATLAERNIMKHKRRSSLTFFMLSTSIAFIILVGTITSMYAASSQINVQNYLGADIVVYPREYVPVSIAENISLVEGVEAVCPVTTGITVKAGDLVLYKQYALKIFGVNASTFPNVTYARDIDFERGTLHEAFKKLAEENGTIIISKGLAESLNIGVGDKIRIETVYGTFVLKIAAIASSIPGFSFTKFKQRAAATDGLVSLETYCNITKMLVVDRFLVKVKEGFDSIKVANAISNEIGGEYDIQVTTTKELAENAVESYEDISKLFTILLSFAVVIAVLGHATSLVTSIQERTWETGVLRSIGLDRKQTVLVYVMEAFIIAFLSYISGVVSSLIIAFELIQSNNLTSDLTLPLTVPYTLYFYVFSLVFFTALIISACLSYKTTKLSIVEILRKGSRL
nr:FtsX-like permease family protein [Candidatus Baldrarchaeota archaeon]